MSSWTSEWEASGACCFWTVFGLRVVELLFGLTTYPCLAYSTYLVLKNKMLPLNLAVIIVIIGLIDILCVSVRLATCVYDFSGRVDTTSIFFIYNRDVWVLMGICTLCFCLERCISVHFPTFPSSKYYALYSIFVAIFVIVTILILTILRLCGISTNFGVFMNAACLFSSFLVMVRTASVSHINYKKALSHRFSHANTVAQTLQMRCDMNLHLRAIQLTKHYVILYLASNVVLLLLQMVIRRVIPGLQYSELLLVQNISHSITAVRACICTAIIVFFHVKRRTTTTRRKTESIAVAQRPIRNVKGQVISFQNKDATDIYFTGYSW